MKFYRSHLLTALSFGIFMFFVPILLLSFGKESGKGICGLSNTSAQDNPCLAQEATISALQSALLQATIDSINHESTVIALESGNEGQNSSNGADTSIPGLPFIEDFSNNDNGWQLSPGVSLVNGTIYMQEMRTSMPIIPIAPLQNFYITFEVIQGHYAGIAVGDLDAGSFHAFYYAFAEGAVKVREITEDNSIDLYEVPNESVIWPFTFGLEYSNGQFDIYLNDEYIMTGQVNLYGGQIALAPYAESDEQYDNLEIRSAR